MSTFTNILQQKINNLEAQIRQLQEQNVQLRNKARWLMEAAASSDMSMLQQPEVQDMPQTPSGPSGQYGGDIDRYTMSNIDRDQFPPGYGHLRNFRQEEQPDGSVKIYNKNGEHVFTYYPGPPAILVRNPTYPNGPFGVWRYNPSTGKWDFTTQDYM